MFRQLRERPTQVTLPPPVYPLFGTQRNDPNIVRKYASHEDRAVRGKINSGRLQNGFLPRCALDPPESAPIPESPGGVVSTFLGSAPPRSVCRSRELLTGVTVCPFDQSRHRVYGVGDTLEMPCT